MGDGRQTYLFSFGPLSGWRTLRAVSPARFLQRLQYPDDPTGIRLQPGDPATTVAP